MNACNYTWLLAESRLTSSLRFYVTVCYMEHSVPFLLAFRKYILWQPVHIRCFIQRPSLHSRSGPYTFSLSDFIEDLLFSHKRHWMKIHPWKWVCLTSERQWNTKSCVRINTGMRREASAAKPLGSWKREVLFSRLKCSSVWLSSSTMSQARSWGAVQEILLMLSSQPGASLSASTASSSIMQQQPCK